MSAQVNTSDPLEKPSSDTAPALEAPTPALEAPTPTLEAPTPALEAPTPALEAPTPALEARKLTLAWGDGEPVVADVSITVQPGETVCLVGKSGMGKTTILHALAGLSTPRAGRVLLHGQDVTGQPGRISYMLQKDLLLPNLTIIDNACLPLTLAGVPKKRAREQARPLLERFGLAEVAQKWPSQLSGGMRQRAAFLRTYLMGNDVVMLDEPFSALDAITRADVRTWFRAESRSLGLSTLMITHDADEACIMANRILVLGHTQTIDDAGSTNEAGSADSTGSTNDASSAESITTPTGPARLIGEVAVERGQNERDFELTPQFLQAKTQVLDYLRS